MPSNDSNLWVPEAPHVVPCRTRYAEMAGTGVGVEGYLGWELRDAATGAVKASSPLQKNVVTNGGFGALGTVPLTTLTEWVAVGTGTSEAGPQETDVALWNEVPPVAGVTTQRSNTEGTGDDGYGFNNDPMYSWSRVVRVIPENKGNGNLTEVGFFSASAGGIMWNHQRFKDSDGQDTTITKTSGDQLYITYVVRTYLPGDTYGSITIAGVTYNYTVRPQGWATRWANTSMQLGRDPIQGQYHTAHETLSLVALTSTLSSGTGFSDLDVDPYVSGSQERTYSLTMEPTAANYTLGIGSFGLYHMGNHPQFQVVLDKRIPKNADNRLVISAKNTWARYTP